MPVAAPSESRRGFGSFGSNPSTRAGHQQGLEGMRDEHTQAQQRGPEGTQGRMAVFPLALRTTVWLCQEEIN